MSLENGVPAQVKFGAKVARGALACAEQTMGQGLSLVSDATILPLPPPCRPRAHGRRRARASVRVARLDDLAPASIPFLTPVMTFPPLPGRRHRPPRRGRSAREHLHGSRGEEVVPDSEEAVVDAAEQGLHARVDGVVRPHRPHGIPGRGQ